MRQGFSEICVFFWLMNYLLCVGGGPKQKKGYFIPMHPHSVAV